MDDRFKISGMFHDVNGVPANEQFEPEALSRRISIPLAALGLRH